jgi:DNA invertase Pin-like site-specific DNA recombinase
MSKRNSTNGKPLRFGALIRVSTERQEEKGESLLTQRTDITRDVATLNGTITHWYGGQEHATPGWEKQELHRLISDAKKGIWNAIVVSHEDRWSRDNGESKHGLEVFRTSGVRFFVGTSEYNLFDPTHCLVLGMSAEIGEFLAANHAKKSLNNRIHRARRGCPTCGLLPFGRTFDSNTETWGVDPEKHAMVQDCASRYLAGESLPKLAKEYGINHAYLWEVLTSRCGDEWLQEFESKKLNIHEVVITKVPRLLDEETITAIRIRAELNKTRNHARTKHAHLLSRFVLCGHCGSAMSVQTNRRGIRYFRHFSKPWGAGHCPNKAKWVRADALEDAVLRDLFDLFGNPDAVQKAIEAATPNLDKVNEYRDRLQRINSALEEVAAARDRIIRLISKGTITEEQAEKELGELKTRQEEFTQEVHRLNASLTNVPTPEEIRQMAEKVSGMGIKRVPIRVLLKQWEANRDYDGMSFEQKRYLVELVFGGRTPEGKRLGVYVKPGEGKTWNYHILGHLIDQPGVSPKPPFEPYQDSEGDWVPEFNGAPCRSGCSKK